MDDKESRLSNAAKNRAEIAEIKRKYVRGMINREEAKLLAQPIINSINLAIITKTNELNKKYGMKRKPSLIDFINLMRNSY